MTREQDGHTDVQSNGESTAVTFFDGGEDFLTQACKIEFLLLPFGRLRREEKSLPVLAVELGRSLWTVQ